MQKKYCKQFNRLHTDQGKNYTSKLVTQFLMNREIKHTYSSAYFQQQNGFAEKNNQDVMNVARAMLCDAKFPKSLWSLAMENGIFVMNRTCKDNIQATPFEIYFGKKPNVSHMKQFGHNVLVYVPKERRKSKLDYHPKEMYMVSHTEQSTN